MNRLLKAIAAFIALCISGLLLSAQSKKPIFYSISGSVDFGRFQNRIELTPSIAIRALPKTYFGLGISASYYSSENTVYKANITQQSIIDDDIWYLGGELFARYLPFENKDGIVNNCFLQTSFETLYGRGKYKDESGQYQYKTNTYTLFTGIGYKQPINDKHAIGLLLNFKLNNAKDSPYRNPIIRVSFEF
ncbi:MAG: hypothetical protein MI866_24165 [Bacteroidales bacterium]|nr:hypothetical protein [Bacteroidales bacterium]